MKKEFCILLSIISLICVITSLFINSDIKHTVVLSMFVLFWQNVAYKNKP